MARKIKVLLSKLGLDVHNRGIITVAKELRNSGMEVVYIGNALPKEIISAAIQEDVSVVGVSSLGGAHLTLGIPLIQEAKEKGFKDEIAFLIGGVFPPADILELKEIAAMSQPYHVAVSPHNFNSTTIGLAASCPGYMRILHIFESVMSKSSNR